MRYLSLFSGIEAAGVAWLPLGWECVGVAEIEPFPCAVLKHHYPDVPNLGDITRITEADIKALGSIDVVVGGFPCQDLSVAGKRKGLMNEDGSVTRSGLFFKAMRIVRWSGARFVLLENVPGIYSSNGGRDFAAVVGEVLGIEFAVPSGGWQNAGVAASERGLFEWATLDAQYFGVAQRRRRMFALGDFGNWADRPPVLFEQHSLSGHPAPSRDAGKGFTHATAPCLTSSVRGVERTGETRGQGPVVAAGDGCLTPWDSQQKRVYSADADHAPTLSGSDGGGGRYPPAYGVITISQTVGALCADSHPGAYSGQDAYTGRLIPTCNHEAPIAAYGIRTANTSSNGWGIQEEVTHTLDTAQGLAIAFHPTQDPISSTDGTTHAMGCGSSQGQATVAVAVALRGSEGGATAELGDEVGHALRASSGGGDKAHVLAPVAVRDISQTLTSNYGKQVDSSDTALGPNVVFPAMQVRRLTPVECARLQGFPDHYLDITYRNKPAADGPKYRALGNSMAVPVMRWIGERIQSVSEIKVEEVV